MKIFVSAGEASSDMHCAQIIERLKGLHEYSFCGVGGDKLAAFGTDLWMHNRELSVGGGPLEVISKLPLRSKIERQLERALLDSRIGGALLVDNGEINLRLAALLHFFKIPIVYYIPPKVWVWRSGRIETIAQHVDLVLSILPFEKPIYENWEIPFEYVGNPLVDEIDFNLSVDTAKAKLGFSSGDEILAVLPGSRFTEIRHHVDVFSSAVNLFAARLRAESRAVPAVVIPIAPAIDLASVQNAFTQRLERSVRLRVVKGDSHTVLKASKAALVKSGTSTLEAALLGVPMVLAYQSSYSARFIFNHIVRYRGFVGMVNLFLARDAESALGWKPLEQPVVRELILGNCRAELISDELHALFLDEEKRRAMLSEFTRAASIVRSPIDPSGSPSAHAAQSIDRVFRRGLQ